MSRKIHSFVDFLALFPELPREKIPNGWNVICPTHSDRKPSLSVTLKGSTILVKCRAGCKTEDVVKSKGLTLSDLFLNSYKPKLGHKQIETVYPYIDANGKPFEVVRTNPKGFYQRQPNGKGDYINNLEGITPTLYHQDKVKAAIAKGEVIYLVEGEKDADQLRSLGLVATTNPMGASKWQDRYSEALKGADLVIIPDNDLMKPKSDTKGWEHAQSVAKSCYGKAKSIRLLQPFSDAKDISDWLDKGHTVDELRQLVDVCLDYEPTSNGRWTLNNKVPSDGKILEMFNLTDMGNAERLIKRHGESLRYCYETGYWLVWNDKLWEKDNGDKIMSLAKETVRNMYAEAANITDDRQRKELVDHAKKSESESKLHAMIALARDLVPIKVQDLDANNMLFNCQNGTIDLRTGILNPHKRENFITLISPVEYDPNAHSDLWGQHLLRVTGNNRELIAYLQQVFGYCLTGEIKEQVMFFVFGPTKTGKSKTLGAVVWVLGDYAKQTPSETLLIKRYGGHSDKARLVGSRMVVAIEAEKGERLASASIKNMTGEDRMTVRFLYKENFEFYPTFKIFLVANDKPLIRGEDSAMWERVKLIPFKQFIPITERDKDLGEKLKEEAKGILTWMVKGCLDWQKHRDLMEPGEVTDETAIYRSEMDILGDFLDDCCIVERTVKVAHNDLYQAYEEWCRRNDEEPITKKMLTIELQGRNFVAKRGHAGRKIWHGLALKCYQEGDSGDTYNPVSIKSL